MKKPVNNNQYSVEFEKNITPERINERNKEREPGSESTEVNISAIRQRDALADIHSNILLNSLYHPEIEDEASKDHFDLRFFGEYPDEKKIRFKIRQEYDLQVICGFTKSDFPQQKIGMNVYPTTREKQEADPIHNANLADFRSNEYRIYRVWGEEMGQITLPHEITKAVSHTWQARPIAFLEESLAVVVDDLAFGYKLQIDEERKWLDEYIKEELSKGVRLQPIVSLLIDDEIKKYEEKLVAPMMGSFSKFLIQKCGIKKFKQLYVSITENMNEDQIKEKIQELLGDSVGNLEKTWMQSFTD